jgi:hypothetical protein
MKKLPQLDPSRAPIQLALNGIAEYRLARAQLEAATRFEDVKKMHDTLEALRAYAAAAKDRQMENLAGELRMRAERKAGQLLIDSRQNGSRQIGGRPLRGEPLETIPTGRVSNLIPTLKELGVTGKEAMYWQEIAELSDTEFEDSLQRLRGSGAHITTNSFLKTASSSGRNGATNPALDAIARIEHALEGLNRALTCAEAMHLRANLFVAASARCGDIYSRLCAAST